MFCQSCKMEVASTFKICPNCGGRQFSSMPINSRPQQVIAPPSYPMQPQGRNNTTSPYVEYASFWRRLWASLIDGIILTLLYIPIVLALVASAALPMAAGVSDESGLGLALAGTGVVLELIALGIVLPWLYSAFLESGQKQSTFGKRLLGLKVIGESGQRISFGVATGRYFAKTFLSGILFIGYLMPLFTSKHQALHDKMAGTYVTFEGGR